MYVAIRSTWETIVYPAFKSWIHSHRDLPVNKLRSCRHQYCLVYGRQKGSRWGVVYCAIDVQ